MYSSKTKICKYDTNYSYQAEGGDSGVADAVPAAPASTAGDKCAAAPGTNPWARSVQVSGGDERCRRRRRAARVELELRPANDKIAGHKSDSILQTTTTSMLKLNKRESKTKRQ